MQTIWTVNPPLARSARWTLVRRDQRASDALAVSLLIGIGVLAALATSVAGLRIPVPGHAILRGTLPLVLGISLVPRRASGSVMSLAALPLQATLSERGATRMDDRSADAAMELRKKEGYF